MRFLRYTISFICISVMAFLPVQLQSQFIVMNSGVNSDLHCVQFIDGNLGYAGGDNGNLVKTTDGGRHWSILNTKINQTINDVYFIDYNVGFLVGENNTFLKTEDGGVHWESLENLNRADYTDLYFVDELTGFAIGHGMEGGVFCKTNDGGQTWQTKMINQDCSGSGLTPGIDCDDIYLTEMSFLDDQNGLIAGFTYNFTYGKHPFICKTEDGGKTFKDISPAENREDWYNGKEVVSVNYMNNNDACAIMNTGSGTDFMFISDYKIKAFEKIELPSNFGSRGRFFTSQFLGRFIGYFAGIIDGESQIIKTTDQGNTFMFLNPPTNNTLYASCFVDQNNGYFVGEKGTIIFISDKSNIVYNAAELRGDLDYDPPHSIATLKKKNKFIQVQLYNFKRNNPNNFSISFYDSQGTKLPIRPRSVKIYSDEIRIKVRVEELLPTTYFYTVSYSDRTVINGKLNISNIAQVLQ